ncbi:MAG: DUF4260 domain-containing protein [Chloroflexota bacterium]
MTITTLNRDEAGNNDNTDRETGLSMPRLMLQMEGLAILVAATATYWLTDAGAWWLYFVLLLVPDVFMLGYLLNTRAGAIIYNIGHTLIVALAFTGVAFAAGWEIGIAVVLIWLAHIGMDRTAGYGLKYGAGFKDTHLARV